MDSLQVTIQGEALATLRTLAAVRNQSVSEVLTAAVGHEEWLTRCALRGEPVYAESPTHRDELQLPKVAVLAPSRPSSPQHQRRRSRY